MPKLTASGQPTIGYLIELTKKDPSTLTKEERKVIEKYGTEFYEKVVKPWQSTYKSLYFPAIEKVIQSQQFYSSLAREAQKSLLIFNQDFNEQLQHLFRLNENLNKTLAATANFTKLIQVNLKQQSPFSSLINKIIFMPKLGEEIKRSLDIAASFKVTLTQSNYEDQSLKYYSFKGGIQSTTTLNNLKVESSGNLDLRLQSLEAKIETLNNENTYLLNKLLSSLENESAKDLYVIENLSYEKKSFTLTVGSSTIEFAPDSDQEQLCSLVLSSTRSRQKVWSLGEIVNRLYTNGYNPQEEAVLSEKVRVLVRHLNDSVAINTSPLRQGIFKYNSKTKTLTLNPELFKK